MLVFVMVVLAAVIAVFSSGKLACLFTRLVCTMSSSYVTYLSVDIIFSAQSIDYGLCLVVFE